MPPMAFVVFLLKQLRCVVLNYPSAGWPSIFLVPSTLIINTGKGRVFDQRVESIKINSGGRSEIPQDNNKPTQSSLFI
jgi:hypothetical protein